MTLPARPLLSGLYHVVALGDDRVLIANAGRSVRLSGGGLAGRALPLLAALDGSRGLAELEAEFPGLVPALLEELHAKGLLTDAAQDADGPATATAIALPGAGTPAQVAERLANATVVASGAGPIASAVAPLLRAAGVGAVAVTPLDLDGADLVLAGSGSEAQRCLDARVPHLVYGQDALLAVVGPLVDPRTPPCHRCAEVRRLSHVVHVEDHLAYRRHRAEAAPGPDTFLAAQTALVAGVLATEALRVVLAAEPRTRGAVLVIDLAAPAITREEVLPVPGCPGCGAERA